jgi:hypothetical protein
VDWIGLSQDRHRWKALVNAVMNLYRVAAQLVASRVALSSTELVSCVPLIKQLMCMCVLTMWAVT